MSTRVPLCNRRVTLRGVVPAIVAMLLLGLLGSAPVATAATKTTYSPASPTFVGPVATGCKKGCSLLTGPFVTTSTTSAATINAAPNALSAMSGPFAMPAPTPASLGPAAAGSARATAAAAPTPIIPTVRCQPIGAGCNSISTSAGGATGVKGLNAVDSASLPTNTSATSSRPIRGCAPAMDPSSRRTTSVRFWSSTPRSSANPHRFHSTT